MTRLGKERSTIKHVTALAVGFTCVAIRYASVPAWIVAGAIASGKPVADKAVDSLREAL